MGPTVRSGGELKTSDRRKRLGPCVCLKQLHTWVNIIKLALILSLTQHMCYN